MNPYHKGNLIVELSLSFAIESVSFSNVLKEEKHFVFATQFLKAATAIGANVREAQNAESKADFIHKMKIAAKEANEADYWLELCSLAKGVPKSPQLKLKITSISKILNKIISTAKTRS